MFKKQSRRPDPFADLLAAPQEEQKQKHVVEEEDGGQEYVSPFRDEQAVVAAQRRRMARYPTTSASSAYATAKPEELGYRKLTEGDRRAKDIQFPTYLQENERKQLVELKELEAKEAHLQYLKDSQKVVELPAVEPQAPEKDEEPAVENVEEPEKVPEAVEAEDKELDAAEEPEAVVEAENVEEPEAVVEAENVEEPAAVPAAVEVESEEPEVAEESEAVGQEPVVEAVEEAEDVIPEQAPEDAVPEPAPETQVSEVGEVAQEPELEAKVSVTQDAQVQDSEAQEQEAETKEVVEDDEKEKELAPAILPDPLKVPMVAIPVQEHKTFFRKLFKSAPVPPPNPVATPDDPEEVVKTPEGLYLTKAVYDKVTAQDNEHKKWVATYVAEEKEKWDNKRADSNRKINSLRNEIKQIKESMEQLRKETQGKIDVKENELTRQLLVKVNVHVKEKNKIFKETELIKKQKLAEKDSVVDKQTEVQKEISELNEQKAKVQAEYIQWSNNLADLSAHVDAKIAKLADIDRRQEKTSNEIEKLEKEKQSLLDEAEAHDVQHAENTKVIEGAKNKTYLPKIGEIDGKISVLLTQLTSVKQQCANERTELSAITKKLEEERIAHEEKLKLEAEERKRKEEDLLGKQKKELEAAAQEARERHEEEMKKLREEYTELETKFKEEQQQKKEALAFANNHRNATRDSSLFEYGTEEEILSA